MLALAHRSSAYGYNRKNWRQTRHSDSFVLGQSTKHNRAHRWLKRRAIVRATRCHELHARAANAASLDVCAQSATLLASLTTQFEGPISKALESCLIRFEWSP
jgi:hypothetical protein